MSGLLDQLPEGANVLVIRLRSLGDCVLTTPALEILKSARPDLNVSVVVEDRFVAVFEGNPDVDRLVRPRATDVGRIKAELAINFHGGTRSMALTAASRARQRAGLGHFRGTAMYNVKIPRAQEILGEERVVHTAEHMASAMFYLGAPRQEVPRAKLFAEPETASRPYAVLHPVASAPDKTWPAASFLRLAAYLESEWGLEPVFIAAAGEDLSPFARYRTLQGVPLGQVKKLMAGASLFVGNDSGPAHMAAAFGLPVALVFGNSEPAIWGPWKTASEMLVNRDDITAIPPERMIEALERLRVRPGGCPPQTKDEERTGLNGSALANHAFRSKA